MKKSNLISICNSYFGMKEGTSQHTNFVKEYNTLCVPLSRSYALKNSDSWCAAYVSVCMTKAGCKDYNEVGAQEMLNKFKKAGRYTTDTSNIEAGNVIFYDWQQNGWVDHTGIITERNGDTIKVIEGNKSDMVGNRTISIKDKNITGFGLLDFESENEDTIETVMETVCGMKYDKSSGELIGLIYKKNGEYKVFMF